MRSNGTKNVWILINFGKDSVTITLPSAMTNVLDGGNAASVTLAQYGVAVLSGK